MNREKPSLPFGWIVKQSSTYPERVYYFNTHSGVTTWEMPHLVKTNNNAIPPPRHAGKEQFSPPCSPRYSPTDSSDDSPYYSEAEKQDPQNEPVFSQFQKNIYDDVISNSPSHDHDEQVRPTKEQSTGQVPKRSQGKCPDTSYKHKVREKVSLKEEKCKSEEKVPRVKFKIEMPDSKLQVKKEVSDKPRKFAQGDRQHSFNISKVLTEIRKDVESSDNVKSSRKKATSRSDSVSSIQRMGEFPLPLTRKIGRREVVRSSEHNKTQDQSPLTKKGESGRREVVHSSERNKTQDKSQLTKKGESGRREVVRSSERNKTQDKSLTAAEAGRFSNLVQLKQGKDPEKVLSSSSKGLWTRKRKISDSPTSDVVPVKIVPKNNLSLKVSVGEKRKVVLSPQRRTKCRRQSSGESLDLNVGDQTVADRLQRVNQNTSAVVVRSPVFDRLNVSSEISPLNIPGRNAAVLSPVRKHRPNHQPDVRRVVSSDSEANTNNSAPGDPPGPRPPPQADRLDRVQEWIDLINGSQEVQPETPAWSQPSVQVQALLEHPQDEDEVCDMEVDEDTDEDEDQMIIDLQEVRGELEFSSSQSAFDLSLPCSATPAEAASQGLYLVVDTSVLVNHLKPLSDLHDEDIQGFGLPTLVFPWVVLQELDALKDNRARLSLSMSCQSKASRAVKYINACFTGRHPRVTGQSHREAAEMVEGLEIECNDDRVLQCCLQFRNKFRTLSVILLSEDVNLCNKAMMCGLDAGSIKNIHGILVLSQAVQEPNSAQGTNTAPVIPLTSSPCPSPVTQGTRPHTSSVTTEKQGHTTFVTPVRPADMNRVQIDEMVVKVKAVVKDTLGLVLETEMKAAYDNIWKTVVYRKPPWSAVDIMESIRKHWMAVFGMILPKQMSNTVNSITTKFQPHKVPLLRGCEVLELIQELMQLMEALQKHSSYKGRVSISIDKLKTVQMQLHHLKTTPTSSTPTSSTPSSSTPSSSTPASSTPASSTAPPTQSRTFTGKPVASQSSTPTQVSVDRPAPSTHRDVTPRPRRPSQAGSAATGTSFDSLVKPSSSSLAGSRIRVRPSSTAQASTSYNTATTAVTATSTARQPVHTQDPTVVQDCFQLVWANVYQVCVEIEASLSQSVNNSYLSLLTRLTRIIKDLRYEFALCLSISPYEISNEREKFQNFCEQLNTVFVKLKHKPVQFESVTVDALMSFFRTTNNRPLLQSGLMQLDSIIRSLYELVKQLPD
ncbi:uncharacterized protein [Haliotis cracherodii]|uniref:uncharacterized protein n=1 Tax=Haliotis cracherodii TaxID=6455 RepID=UPI0039EC3699